MNYEDIKKANASLSAMDIKGKTYIPVNERVKAFRMLCPDGTIETELVKYDDANIITKATIKVNGEVVATGYAKEVEGSSNINRTSALENAETSAVGRALGFLGIGIDTSIASYEEVTNAQLFQEGNKLATEPEKAGLKASCYAKGKDYKALLNIVGCKNIDELTAVQYSRAMNILTGGK